MHTRPRTGPVAFLLIALTAGVVPTFALTPTATAAPVTEATAPVACPEPTAPHTRYGRFLFGQGIPWRVELGEGMDPDESWVTATHRDINATPEVVTRTYRLHPGLNDLQVNAGRSGVTRLEWSLAREGGLPCTDSLQQSVYDVEKERPYAKFSPRLDGAVFDQHEVATFTYTCEYEGAQATEDDCQSDWGPPGTAKGTITRPLDTSTPGWQEHWEPLYHTRLPDGTGTQVGGGGFYYYVNPAPPPPVEPGDGVSTEVSLQQRDVATGEWEDLPKGATTVAGNPVRVVSKTHNGDHVVHQVRVELRDAATGELVAGESTLDLPMTAGSTWERWSHWDTADLAWNADGSPRTTPVGLDVELIVDGKGEDGPEASTDLRVTPRPVILVHGWKSYAESSWGGYQQMLTAAHPLLRGYAVGDGQFPGRMNTNGGGTGCTFCGTKTIAQNAQEEAKYIQAVREASGAHHVDIVAHSMGGLISRFYVQELMPDGFDWAHPVATRLIQMGTPNMGSPLADSILGFGALGESRIPFYPASYHLTPEYVKGYFNQMIYDSRGVKISNMAGTMLPLLLFPPLPQLLGDGIVPAPSAYWKLKDVQDSPGRFHTAMTESQEDFDEYVLPRLRAHLSDGAYRSAADTAPAPASSAGPAGARAEESPSITGVHAIELAAGESARVPVLVETGAVGVLSVDANVRLELVQPSGRVLATSTVVEGMTQLQLDATRADTGPAHLVVTDLAHEARTVDVLTTVSDSDLTLDAAFEVRRQGQSLFTQVKVAVAEAAGPTTGALVTARLADGEPVTLSDDGQHADGAADDGVYGGHVAGLQDGDNVMVVELSAAGRHRVLVRPVLADADVPDGTPVEPGPGPVDPGPGPGTDPGPGPVDPGPGPGPGTNPVSPPPTPAPPATTQPDRGHEVLARFDAVAKGARLRPTVVTSLRRLVVRATKATDAPKALRTFRGAVKRLGRRDRITTSQARALRRFAGQAQSMLTAQRTSAPHQGNRELNSAADDS